MSPILRGNGRAHRREFFWLYQGLAISMIVGLYLKSLEFVNLLFIQPGLNLFMLTAAAVFAAIGIAGLARLVALAALHRVQFVYRDRIETRTFRHRGSARLLPGAPHVFFGNLALVLTDDHRLAHYGVSDRGDAIARLRAEGVRTRVFPIGFGPALLILLVVCSALSQAVGFNLRPLFYVGLLAIAFQFCLRSAGRLEPPTRAFHRPTPGRFLVPFVMMLGGFSLNVETTDRTYLPWSDDDRAIDAAFVRLEQTGDAHSVCAFHGAHPRLIDWRLKYAKPGMNCAGTADTGATIGRLPANEGEQK